MYIEVTQPHRTSNKPRASAMGARGTRSQSRRGARARQTTPTTRRGTGRGTTQLTAVQRKWDLDAYRAVMAAFCLRSDGTLTNEQHEALRLLRVELNLTTDTHDQIKLQTRSELYPDNSFSGESDTKSPPAKRKHVTSDNSNDSASSSDSSSEDSWQADQDLKDHFHKHRELSIWDFDRRIIGVPQARYQPHVPLWQRPIPAVNLCELVTQTEIVQVVSVLQNERQRILRELERLKTNPGAEDDFHPPRK
eukprot:c15636_g1_i2.p1 GENE.c15636_g1_i2~~c15636_g1_i2.p1  ORF type:complete len:250 (+),score=40.93 c15636_g1_i2:557-1306(+)